MSSDDSDVRLTSSVINRRWVDIVTSRADDDDDDDDLRLRVATYNILSDNYVRDDRYLYCPAQLRYMSSRHERIIAEINNMQPHVVCLQVSLSLSLSLSLSHSHSICLFHSTTFIQSDTNSAFFCAICSCAVLKFLCSSNEKIYAVMQYVKCSFQNLFENCSSSRINIKVTLTVFWLSSLCIGLSQLLIDA